MSWGYVKKVIHELPEDRKAILRKFLITKTATGTGQYSGIEWNKFILNDFKKESFYWGKNKKKIVGFHIMPYILRENDIKNAVVKTKCSEGKANKLIGMGWEQAEKDFCDVNNPEYVDYDPETGNFHLKKCIGYQIVLLHWNGDTYAETGRPICTGPGKWNSLEKSELIKEIKSSKMYYPNIDSDEIISLPKLFDIIADIFE